MFQINDFPYFFYLFSHLFNSCHFKGEKQTGESALSAFTEIIKKSLNESGIKGVDVNSRIITAFRKKMFLLKRKVDSVKEEGRIVRVSEGCLINRNQLHGSTFISTRTSG